MPAGKILCFTVCPVTLFTYIVTMGALLFFEHLLCRHRVPSLWPSYEVDNLQTGKLRDGELK